MTVTYFRNLCIGRGVFYFTATADPFRVGVRATTTAVPLYVQGSIRVVHVRATTTLRQIRVRARP